VIKEKADLYSPIYSALPEELKNALIDYNDRESIISGMGQTFFYEHGFLDAFMLIRVLFHSRI